MKLQIVFLLLIVVAHVASAKPLAPGQLRCNDLVNPLGVDDQKPRFSWLVHDDTPGAVQTAFQIQAAISVSELRAGKNLIWDSGKITASNNTQVVYSGKDLHQGQRIHWRVRTWDRDGNVSPWSESAWFETGLLDDKNWNNAQWISDNRDLNGLQYVPDTCMGAWIQSGSGKSVTRFFKDIQLPDKAIVSAVAWRGTAGLKVPCAVIANWDETPDDLRKHLMRLFTGKPDDFFDLAFLLKRGEKNRIELILGEAAKDFSATVGMRIVFADGSEMIVSSGSDWKVLDEGKLSYPVAVAAPYGDSKFRKVAWFSLNDLPPAWYRGSFEIKGEVTRARLYLCALGQGLPSVNGQMVEDWVMGVPQSDYEELAYYTTHDITRHLKQGVNTLSVLLDAGWYHQVGGFGHAGFSYGSPGLKALAVIEYADGRTQSFTSGATWQWKEGAIRSSNIYRGSLIDLGMNHDEWMSSQSTNGWNSVEVVPPLSPKTVAMDVAPVRRVQELSAVRKWQVGPKTWLFDIGEMINGWVRFTIKEDEGTTIRIRYSEYAENGVIENVPLSHWLCHRLPQRDEIITDGESHIFEPLFTPHSFRFVEISGVSAPPEDLSGILVRSDVRPLATFESSDPTLNRLFANGMRSWRNYITHVIGDLPRERCVWGAESIYCEVPGFLCFDLAPNHRLMNSQWLTGRMTRDGIPGNIAVGLRLTTTTQGYIWSVTPVFIASQLFELYGDLEPARMYYDKLLKLVRYPETTGEREGTVPVPNNLADHAPIYAVKRNPVSNELLTAMVYYEALQRFARIADALEKPEDAAHTRRHAQKVRNTILSFYDTEKHTFGNGTQNSLALAFGIFDDPEEQRKLAASLAAYYQTNGHQFDGGFLSYEIYPQLSKYGYVDDALAMLVNTSSPGPAQSIRDFDATTFYETYWDNRVNQMKVGHNFIAFAHSIGWMITDLAGIRYRTPASSRTQLKLAPRFARNLKFVRSSVEMHSGMATSEWNRNAGDISWNVTIPPNTETIVELEAIDYAMITVGGQKLEKAGVQTQIKDGKLVFPLKCGSYRFVLTPVEN